MIKQLRQYLSDDIYSFHMPGHKRNPAFLPPDLPYWDITEISGMDNLHAPHGIIDQLQKRLCAAYGADESYLLVNGSSVGILAAVFAACVACINSPKDPPVHISRNAHKSVFNALALCGGVPIYIQPEYYPDGLVGGVAPEAFSSARVAVVTCPTYEGLVCDIKAIADRVHANDGILIVDEAHGAHFSKERAFAGRGHRD
jgi:arginine/lysine/ornithine decarboxylase